MGKYVDGFLIPIAKEKVEEYREMAQKAGEVWMEHGALEFCECVGDDLEILIPQGGWSHNPDKDFSTLAHVVGVRKGETDGERIVGVQFYGPRLNRVFVSESTS